MKSRMRQGQGQGQGQGQTSARHGSRRLTTTTKMGNTPRESILVSAKAYAQGGTIRRSIDLVEAGRTREVLPLTKVVVPDFIKRELQGPRTRSTDKRARRQAGDEDIADRLGTFESEAVSEMMHNEKLLRAISEAQELRRGLDRRRLGTAATPEMLLAQASEIADRQVAEEEKRALDEVYSCKSKGVAIISMVTKVLGKLRHAAKKVSATQPKKKDSIKNLDHLAQAEAETKQLRQRLLSLKHNRRQSGALNRATKLPSLADLDQRRRHNLDSETRMAKNPVAQRPISSLTGKIAADLRSYSTRLTSALGFRSQRSMNGSLRRSLTCTDRYVVGGFEQLCSAADHLCQAYIQGTGNPEWEKYHQHFVDCPKSQLLGPKLNCPQHPSNRINGLQNTAEHVKRLQGTVKHLNVALENRYRDLHEWLDN